MLHKIFLMLFLVSNLSYGVTGNKVWRVPGGSTLPSWGPVNLADGTNAVTGVLGLTSGGTGVSTPYSIVEGRTTTKLAIVRGGASSTPSGSSCGTNVGEGYTCHRNATGTYTVTYNVAFSDTPACTCSLEINDVCFVQTPTSTSVTVTAGAGSADRLFSFICIGQK